MCFPFFFFSPGKLKYHPIMKSFLPRPALVRHVGFPATVASLHRPQSVSLMPYIIIYLFTCYFAFKTGVSNSRLFNI